MIPHKCTSYCEPDEKIHCLPDRGECDCTIEDFQKSLGRDYDIVKFRKESDVTAELHERTLAQAVVEGTLILRQSPSFSTGYLIWLRDKES